MNLRRSAGFTLIELLVVVDPLTNTAGTRHFFTNTTGTIWQSASAMGAAGSDTAPPLGGTPVQ